LNKYKGLTTMQDTPEKKVITDDLEIIDFFRLLQKSKERLWLWQQNPETPTERKIHFTMVRKVDVLKKVIELTPLTDEGFTFTNTDFELFLYSRGRNMAVRFKAREIDNGYIVFILPEKVNYLSEELAKKINLVEPEDEGQKAHLREQPRKQAGEKQTVKIKKNQEEKVLQYNLYDISAGGLALKSPDPGVFKKGDTIEVLSINAKELPSPISGNVVSVRHIVDDDIFKIGVQFKK